jgi:hypothetical protein
MAVPDRKGSDDSPCRLVDREHVVHEAAPAVELDLGSILLIIFGRNLRSNVKQGQTYLQKAFSAIYYEKIVNIGPIFCHCFWLNFSP